jgi:hypothetical protein
MRVTCSWGDAWQTSSKIVDALQPSLLSERPGPLAIKTISPPDNANRNHIPYQSTLSPSPRNIHLLWLEYETGIAGRKPAQDFTREERGRVKHKYHRRKVVWDCESRLIRGGLTSEEASDRIYQVYGASTTVTTIINHVKRDVCGTLHQLLQV